MSCSEPRSLQFTYSMTRKSFPKSPKTSCYWINQSNILKYVHATTAQTKENWKQLQFHMKFLFTSWYKSVWLHVQIHTWICFKAYFHFTMWSTMKGGFIIEPFIIYFTNSNCVQLDKDYFKRFEQLQTLIHNFVGRKRL